MYVLMSDKLQLVVDAEMMGPFFWVDDKLESISEIAYALHGY
jgi:hypothetical protein